MFGPGLLAAPTRLFAPDVPDHALYDAITQMTLPKTARDHLEALMTTLNYQWVYDSDVAHEIADRGRAQGKAEGIAQGKADDVLAVLAARGFMIDAATPRHSHRLYRRGTADPVAHPRRRREHSRRGLRQAARLAVVPSDAD